MKVPKSFDRDLQDAYHGHLDLNELIKRQEQFLRGLAKFALRYKTSFMFSDEDDLYQEACYWLLDSMWEYDESRGRTLVDFVVYNIGVRLAGVVKFEKNIKRHPLPNGSWRVDIWDSSTRDGEGNTVESTIPSVVVNTEVQVAIRQAFALADESLSDIAKELMVALIECDGNLNAAVRLIAPRKHIRKRYGTDESHLKYRMRFKVLPEISNFFEIGDIIPL